MFVFSKETHFSLSGTEYDTKYSVDATFSYDFQDQIYTNYKIKAVIVINDKMTINGALDPLNQGTITPEQWTYFKSGEFCALSSDTELKNDIVVINVDNPPKSVIKKYLCDNPTWEISMKVNDDELCLSLKYGIWITRCMKNKFKDEL